MARSLLSVPEPAFETDADRYCRSRASPAVETRRTDFGPRRDRSIGLQNADGEIRIFGEGE